MTKTAPSEVLVPTNGPAAAQLAFELGALLEANGLELRPELAVELTYENWENMGRALTFIGEAWQWWIGDWLIWGEKLFGEEAAQAVDPNDRMDMATRVTGLAPASLQNIARICTRVAKERRRTPPLKFHHHEPVASLDPDEQVEWLDRCVNEGWTKEELREAIRASKRPPTEDEPVPDPGPPTMSVCERIEEVARLIFHQGQRTSDGGLLVPAEIAAQLGAALGEE